MRPRITDCLLLIALAGCSCSHAEEPKRPAPPTQTYTGMSDTSAGVAIDDKTFIAANDENSTFGLYRVDKPGEPIRKIAWAAQLGINVFADKHPETDIEAATRVGDVIYWITSHGRSKDGKWRANRHRFFATKIVTGDDGVSLEPVGKPYAGLAVKLADDPRLTKLGLDEALGPIGLDVKDLAPKDEGINIEGLAGSPDGKTLLIGFRNPIPDSKALIVPLTNPDAVLTDSAVPEFGDPILLDLGVSKGDKSVPLGVRGMEYDKALGAYLIIAGRSGKGRPFGLFRWSGKTSEPPELLAKPTEALNAAKGFTPEALLLYDGGKRVQVLSDDGSLKVKVASPAECKEGAYNNGKCEAKDLLDESRKTFKSLWLDIAGNHSTTNKDNTNQP